MKPKSSGYIVKGFLFLLVSRIVGMPGYAQMSIPVITADYGAPVYGVKSVVGFLNGASTTSPPDSLINPLQPKLWRGWFGKPWTDLYQRASAAGARSQIILSEYWLWMRGSQRWPFENWIVWENLVRKIARDNRNRTRTLLYDIWNEPDGRDFWGGTRDQFFEAYLRAYRVLRAELGPDVMVGGPSIAFSYDKQFLSAMADYCLKHGCEINFLSWHELDWASIPSIADHLIDARKSFVDNPAYSSLRIKEILINEIVGLYSNHRPGRIVGYFYYLEKGRADGSCKGCWIDSNGMGECSNDTLDGLLTPDSFQPRSVWWVYKAYAEGVASRVTSTTTNPRVVGLASTTPTSGARVLVGFFNDYHGGSQTPVDVVLQMNNLTALGFRSGDRARLNIQKIPDTDEDPVLALTTVREEDTTVWNGSLQTFILGFLPNEAYLVTLSRY